MTLARSLFEYLIGVYPADRAYTPAQFERGTMPPLVAHYLGRLLEERAASGLDALHEGSGGWIDLAHPEVQEALARFSEVLARHAVIPASEWEAALRKAIDQVVAFLVRPARTLTEHVFPEDARSQPASVVRRRLGFFAAYPYLRDVVDAYLDQRELARIERTRFTTLISRIEEQMTEDYGAADWIRLLTPLFDLAAVVPNSGGRVPASQLETFFAEKNAPAIRQRLADGRGGDALDRDALRRLIEAPEPAAPGVTAPEAVPTRSASRPAEPPAGPVPLWKQFQGGSFPPPDEPVQPAPAARPAEPEPAAPSGAPLPLWKRFQSPLRAAPSPAPAAGTGRSGPPADLGSLERVVLGDRGSRNRDLFIKHLFGGSTEAYQAALRLLFGAPNWTEASQIIAQEVFLRHQVNIYSEPAVAFTDAVEARYHS